MPGLTQASKNKATNTVIARPVSLKNDFPIVSPQRKWEALKKYLSNNYSNPKILENSLLTELGFAINIPKKVTEFFKYFQPNQLFLVGGAIRNALTRKPINDFDFVAFLSAEKIKKMFANYQIKGNGKKTTLTISYQKYIFDILPTECTSYQEALMRDKLTREMVLALLQLDYRQRDFTINALYWNPHMGLIDICDSMADLLVKRVITPIQPGSKHFKVQNAVRILRAVRFAAQFNLTISKNLRHIMLSNAFFLYTVNINKINTEYQSLVNTVGEIHANQLYQHYSLYDLLSTRLSLQTLTWRDFWSNHMKPSVWIKSSKELTQIGEGIKNYLSEKDLRTLKCISKNPFTLFKPAQTQQTSIINSGLGVCAKLF